MPSVVQGHMEIPMDGGYFVDDDDGFFHGDDDDYGNEGGEGNSFPGSTSNDSISSSNVDLDDVVGGSQRRRWTHIENEQSHQQNLFLLLPQLHREIIRLESMRLVGSTEQICEGCGLTTNHSRLWRCNECTMLKHSSPMLCDACTVNGHINNPHCMEVLCKGESVFRKPFGHETLTFKLEIELCPVCNCVHPLGNMAANGFNEKNSITVFVASQNGIFQCACPLGGSKCRNCQLELTCGPTAFDSIPCEPSHKKGATWLRTVFFHSSIPYDVRGAVALMLWHGQ